MIADNNTQLDQMKSMLIGAMIKRSIKANCLEYSAPQGSGKQVKIDATMRQGIDKATAKKRAIEVLAWVGLHEIENLMPSELSGGMAKRVGLARTICHKPDIVFLDEPTTGLDPIMSDVINRLIVRLHKDSGTTILSITHDMKSAAMISDQIALLCHGRVHRQIASDQLDYDQDPMLRQLVEGRAEGPINCSGWGKEMEEAIHR